MLSRRRTLLRPVVLLAAALTGVQAHAIIGGTPDTAGSVYQYMGTMANGFSGTPIAPNWFVTANHVAPGVGTTYSNPDGNFTVTNVINVPNFAGNSLGLTGATDLALVQVSGTFAHFYGYGSVLTGTDPNANGTGGTNGTLTTFVGSGSYSPAISVAPGGGIGQTTATNTVDAVVGASFDNTNFWAAYAYDLDDGSLAHNALGGPLGSLREGGIAGGDSGGGWFVNGGGALPMIIAVSSGVESQHDATGSGNTNYWEAGGVGVGTDIGYYSAFIAQTTGIGPVTPVPEPATCAAFGLGALALLRRRRRA